MLSLLGIISDRIYANHDKSNSIIEGTINEIANFLQREAPSYIEDLLKEIDNIKISIQDVF